MKSALHKAGNTLKIGTQVRVRRLRTDSIGYIWDVRFKNGRRQIRTLCLSDVTLEVRKNDAWAIGTVTKTALTKTKVEYNKEKRAFYVGTTKVNYVSQATFSPLGMFI